MLIVTLSVMQPHFSALLSVWHSLVMEVLNCALKSDLLIILFNTRVFLFVLRSRSSLFKRDCLISEEMKEDSCVDLLPLVNVLM